MFISGLEIFKSFGYGYEDGFSKSGTGMAKPYTRHTFLILSPYFHYTFSQNSKTLTFAKVEAKSHFDENLKLTLELLTLKIINFKVNLKKL